jgi:hypothetical protein
VLLSTNDGTCIQEGCAFGRLFTFIFRIHHH